MTLTDDSFKRLSLRYKCECPHTSLSPPCQPDDPTEPFVGRGDTRSKQTAPNGAFTCRVVVNYSRLRKTIQGTCPFRNEKGDGPASPFKLIKLSRGRDEVGET